MLEAQNKASKQKYVAAIEDGWDYQNCSLCYEIQVTGSLAGWQPVAVFVVFLSAMRIHEVS